VAWLATLQQRFLEGRNCDVVVRASIEQPAAKHTRAGNGAVMRNGANRRQQQQQQQQPQAQGQEQEQEQRTVDIPCPSIILTTRLRYFDAALSGVYVETKESRVEIVLSQAIDDFKLLIKLSCGSSYVQDGDMPLSRSTRLRLAFLGSAFEFVDCVQECLQSLTEEGDMTLEGALTLLNEMPEKLWELEAAMAVRSKIIKVLTTAVEEQVKQSKGDGVGAEGGAAAAELASKLTKALVDVIDELGPRKMQGETAEEQKNQALRLAGEALCMALGPVDGLFGEGTTSLGIPCVKAGDFYALLSFRADIKGLSAVVMESCSGPRSSICGLRMMRTTCYAPGYRNPNAFLSLKAGPFFSSLYRCSACITCPKTSLAPS
jgi:hypothetical protein